MLSPKPLASGSNVTGIGPAGPLIVTVALAKFAPGKENDQRFERFGRFWYGTKPAGGHATPLGVAGRAFCGPKTWTALAGRGGMLPPVVSPVAIDARGGCRSQRRWPTAVLLAPKSSMYRSIASTPLRAERDVGVGGAGRAVAGEAQPRHRRLVRQRIVGGHHERGGLDLRRLRTRQELQRPASRPARGSS